MVVSDTHVLLYDALNPEALSASAQEAIAAAMDRGELGCSDVSLWEIAMLIEKDRVRVDTSTEQFLQWVIGARLLHVLPVTPTIAALAMSSAVSGSDPADRLIAATAMVHDAPLVTKDRHLHGIPGLRTIW